MNRKFKMPKGKRGVKMLTKNKTKGLPYLIIIISIIAAAIVTACKIKPTEVSDFTFLGLDESITNGASSNPKPSKSDENTDADSDVTLKNYEGEYKSIHKYTEGSAENGTYRTFYYKATLKEESEKWTLYWYKGDDNGEYFTKYELKRTLKRDIKNDAGGKKAFSDWETHYVTFSDDGNYLYLTPDRWAGPIIFKK